MIAGDQRLVIPLGIEAVRVNAQDDWIFIARLRAKFKP
jgi:hypothetical protein